MKGRKVRVLLAGNGRTNERPKNYLVSIHEPASLSFHLLPVCQTAVTSEVYTLEHYIIIVTMGFFDDLFGGSDDKKSGSHNPFAKFGKKQGGFQGSGQSLGGSKPGDVIQIVLPSPGPLGIRVEKKTNSSASTIVNEVVAGSQAEAAGLERGDVLCFANTNGQDEIPYDMFLKLAKAEERPIYLEARRFHGPKSSSSSAAAADAGGRSGSTGSRSADAEARRKAMVAAAEARDKAHKAKSKPLKHVTKTTLKLQQQNLEKNGPSGSEASDVPLSEASRIAAARAKDDEAQLTSQLGYNPYEAAKSTAGQARNATTTVQHGNISSSSAGDHLPTVAPPQDPTSVADDDEEVVLPSEFEEALTILVSTPDQAAAKNSLTIMRKLIVNATTKGQEEGDDGAKFRKVRLANAKIKAAIVDVSGAIDVMLAVGFSLEETEGGESCLLFPSDYAGPDWLPVALKKLEAVSSQ